MARRSEEYLSAAVEIECLGGMDAFVVHIANHEGIMALKNLLDAKLEIGLAGQRLRPVRTQCNLSMDFARADQIARFARPELDIVSIMVQDPIQIVTVPGGFPLESEVVGIHGIALLPSSIDCVRRFRRTPDRTCLSGGSGGNVKSQLSSGSRSQVRSVRTICGDASACTHHNPCAGEGSRRETVKGSALRSDSRCQKQGIRQSAQGRFEFTGRRRAYNRADSPVGMAVGPVRDAIEHLKPDRRIALQLQCSAFRVRGAGNHEDIGIGIRGTLEEGKEGLNAEIRRDRERIHPHRSARPEPRVRVGFAGGANVAPFGVSDDEKPSLASLKDQARQRVEPVRAEPLEERDLWLHNRNQTVGNLDQPSSESQRAIGRILKMPGCQGGRRRIDPDARGRAMRVAFQKCIVEGRRLHESFPTG